MNQTPVSPTPVPSGVEGPQGGSSTMKWLLIILVIIIVLGGTYWVYAKYGKGTTTTTTSPSPTLTSKVSPSTSAAVSPAASSSITADWKTYTSSKYNYSIKYPSDWTVEEMNNNAIFKNSSSGPNPLTITISGVQNKTLDEMVQEMVDNTQTKNTQKTTLASQPAYEGIGLGMISYYELYTVKGGYFYQLILDSNGNDDTLSNLKSGLSKDQTLMTSSFQFTQ